MRGNKSLLTAVISIALICAAVFFIVKYGFRKNPGATPEQLAFICSNCGNEFQVRTKQLDELHAENPDQGSNMLKCPICKKFKGVRAIRCMYCGKHYLERQSIEPFSCISKTNLLGLMFFL